MSRLETYLPRLYRYAYSLARNEDVAKDLVQQCALRALAARSVPEDESAFRAWLFVILRNAHIDRLRRERPTVDLDDPALDELPHGEYWDGDERLINVMNVRQAISRLSDTHREIVGLVDMGGLSYAEAAQVLNVPVGTVMSRISRARARLLALIAESNVQSLAPQRRGRR
jgi:RNA polymerase sigma-70 factor (ECF subfamily)